MFIYFDRNGVLQEVINDKAARLGDLNANEIYVYVDEVELDDIWLTLKRPDGTLSVEKSFIANKVVRELPYDPKRDMKFFKDFKEYEFYKFTISDEITIEGVYQATIRMTYEDALSALGVLVFKAETGVIKSDQNITQAQYDYLIWYVGSWQGQIGDLEDAMGIAQADILGLKNRMNVAEQDINKIEDGTTVVNKALKDDLGNTIKSTYANKLDLVYSSSNNRIAITLKSADGTTIDADLITLQKATTSVDGLLSKEDKAKVDALWALLENNDEDFVDTINELLEIFKNYPESMDIVAEFAKKADKTYVDDELDKKTDKIVLTNLVNNGDLLVAKPSPNQNEPLGFVYATATDMTLVGGRAKFTATAQFGRINAISVNSTDYIGNKVYVFARFKSDSDNVRLTFGQFVQAYHPGDGNFNFLSMINDVTASDRNPQVSDYRTSNWTPIEVDYIGVIDLTATFGAGNEPTKEQMDAVMALKGYFDTTEISLKDLYKLKAEKNVDNMFTVPQTVPKATLNQHAVNLGQVNQLIIDADNETDKKWHENKNLFNIATVSPEGQWCAWNTGKIEYYPANIYAEHYCNSDFIEIDGGEDYTYTGGNPYPGWQQHRGIAWFDEDKIYISGQDGGQFNVDSIVYSAPANAKYCIISFSTLVSANTNVQLEKGNVATAYQPYYGNLYYLDNLLVKSEQIEDTVSTKTYIRCADSYDLVVGDSFELFYKGILEVFNYENYNVLCQCDIGKCLTRKFMVDNITNSMIGNHTLQITLYSNEMKQLDQKTITLKVHAVATSPLTQKVILCVGDSLTVDGVWVDEFGRRLTKSSDKTTWNATAPVGLGLSNITFIGKKTSVGGFKYEGYGGWRFEHYLDTTGVSTMYWLTVASHDKDSGDQESVWEDANGVEWQLETVEASRLKFKKYNGAGLMPPSGTLNWVSGGVHTDDIVFTSAEVAEGNPFLYSGAINFSAYCSDMGVATIDEVYILLGWNNATKTTPSMTNCKAFIDLLRTFNPNIKVVLMGLQIPSLDGCGVNYGASGIYSRYMELVNYVHNLDDAYKGVAEDYVGGVYSVNLSGQFDTEYNMSIISSTPNTRNPTVISMQNNGVHPAVVGYYQIADVAYRWYNGNN